ESFTTLDGQKRALTNDMLLIADRQKGIALAGVMGGQNTEINDRTQDVLIESANFKAQNVRATSRKLDLRTDSSYRFERGADVEICEWASKRAAVLIQQLAGGGIFAGAVDAYPKRHTAHQIKLRTRKVGELLGIDMPTADQKRFLSNLQFKISSATESEITTEVPSFRADMKREADLIEEIARMYGVDKIPSTPPRGAIGSNAFDTVYDQYASVRQILTGFGLTEAQGQTLISDESVKRLFGESAIAQLIRLENPLSSDMNVLRPSLLPGLLDSLRHNLHHQQTDLRLFETGRVFGRNAGETREERRVAIALTGHRSGQFWAGPEREAKLDLYDLKGVLEEFFDQLGVRGVQWNRNETPGVLYLESATVLVGKHPAGQFGQLNPLLSRHYDLRDGVLLAEFNLDFILQRRNLSKSFKSLASFPSIRRDVAMVLDESASHERIV